MSEISPAAVLALLRDFEIVEEGDGLTAESDLFSHGLDSMAVMQLVLAVEEHWAVGLDPRDLTREHLHSASAVAELIASKKGAASASLR